MIESLASLDKATGLNDLAGVVILAGGASRRMGTPKAKLALPNGEIVLDYHVRQAVDLNVPIMIADNARGFTVTPELLLYPLKSTIFHITDYGSTATTNHSNSGGALVAIESAMQAIIESTGNYSSKEQPSWLMVISCDSLIPATELWQTLQPHTRMSINNRKVEAQQAHPVTDKKVVCLTDETYPYPLLGLYHLGVEPDLRAYIDSGERRVIKFIEPFLQTIPLSKKWAHLTNFNTAEDFQQACAALNNV